MKREFILEVISFLFALLFIYAAVVKLFDYQKFSIQIGQSPLLTGFGGIIPWLVIGLELILAFLFFFLRTRMLAFFGGFTLMTLFTFYILAILHFSPYVPCSCGGILERLGWTEHLIFNIFFIVLGLIGIILQAKQTISHQESMHEAKPL